MVGVKLNLGASDDHRDGYLCVDMVPQCIKCGYMSADLRDDWPWESGSVDEILAKDVFEHIPQVYQFFQINQSFRWDRVRYGIIHVMNEAHRVLRPGGRLEIIVPCYPGIAPICDPTHCSWWNSDLRYYFDERWNHAGGERGRFGRAYGITALFRTLPESRSGVNWRPVPYAADAPDRHKIFVVLEALK